MLLFDNSPIQNLINFSKENEKFIRLEHAKMINYYTTNPDELQDLMQIIKNENTGDDYYSNIINHEASRLIDDPVNAKWKFDEDMLLDSIDKINKQIRKIPKEVLIGEENARVYFYDLNPIPDNTGSILVLSKLIINWRNFEAEFMALTN